MYTGEDWPYEPLQEAIAATPETHAHVTLLGERQDVEAIRDIITAYSAIMRYGRPFERLYRYVVRRPDTHLLLAFEEPFRHATFTVQKQRLDLLLALVKQRSTLLYDVTYQDNGTTERIQNFSYAGQGTLIDAAEQALKERGWTEPAKNGTRWYSLLERREAKKQGKKLECHSSDRFWNELKHLWIKPKK